MFFWLSRHVFFFFFFFSFLPGPAAARGALERDRDATRVAEAAARENCWDFCKEIEDMKCTG